MSLVNLILTGSLGDPVLDVHRDCFQELRSHPRINLLPGHWQCLGRQDRLTFSDWCIKIFFVCNSSLLQTPTPPISKMGSTRDECLKNCCLPAVKTVCPGGHVSQLQLWHGTQKHLNTFHDHSELCCRKTSWRCNRLTKTWRS